MGRLGHRGGEGVSMAKKIDKLTKGDHKDKGKKQGK